MDLTITGKTKVTPATAAVLYGGSGGRGGVLDYVDRYKWLSLDMAEPNLGIPLSGVDIGALQTGSYVFSSTQTYLLCSNVKGERGWILYNAADQQFDSEERPDLTNVDMSLEYLLYKNPVTINFQLSSESFGNFNFRPGIAGSSASSPILFEAGASTGMVTLSWATNKVDARAIKTFYLSTPNGETNSIFENITGDYSFRTYTLPNIDTNVLGTSTFGLTAEDWLKNRAISFLTVRSLGPIFFGVTSNIAVNMNSASIIAGNKTTTGSPAGTYSFSPNNQRLFIAWPVALGYTPDRFFVAGSPLPVFINTTSLNNYATANVTIGGNSISYRVFVTENFYNLSPMVLTLV